MFSPELLTCYFVIRKMWKCPHQLYNQWMVKVNRGSTDASMTCILTGMVCNANIDMMLLKCLMWVLLSHQPDFLSLLLSNTRFRMGKQLLMGEHHHCTPQIHMEPKNWPHTNRSSRTQFLGFDVNIFGILVRASSRISMCWLDRHKTTHTHIYIYICIYVYIYIYVPIVTYILYIYIIFAI